MGKLTRNRYGAAVNVRFDFYGTKAYELGEAGQHFMAAIASSLGTSEDDARPMQPAVRSATMASQAPRRTAELRAQASLYPW
jgi:hypothetical protein